MKNEKSHGNRIAIFCLASYPNTSPQDPCLSDNLWSLVLRMTFQVKKLSGSQVRLLPILEMTKSSHLKIDAKGGPVFFK